MNILLILGITSLIKKIEVNKDIIKKELPMMLIITVLFGVLLINNDFPTDYSFEDIEKVVGPATTSTIIENKDKLKRLRYVHILPFVKKTIVNIAGTFCVTGKLNRMKRNDLIKLAEEKGWKSLSGVNKDCNYLVTNDTTSGSSKNKKAQELGTKIIDEEAFYNLLGI